MIAFLEGEVAEKAGDRVVLSLGGTGYEVLVPVSTLARLPAVGRTARLHTRLQVRDDALVAAGIPPASAELTMVPANTVPVQGSQARSVLALIDALEDLDDVQAVHANFDIPEEVLAQAG